MPTKKIFRISVFIALAAFFFASFSFAEGEKTGFVKTTWRKLYNIFKKTENEKPLARAVNTQTAKPAVEEKENAGIVKTALRKILGIFKKHKKKSVPPEEEKKAKSPQLNANTKEAPTPLAELLEKPAVGGMTGVGENASYGTAVPAKPALSEKPSVAAPSAESPAQRPEAAEKRSSEKQAEEEPEIDESTLDNLKSEDIIDSIKRMLEGSPDILNVIPELEVSYDKDKKVLSVRYAVEDIFTNVEELDKKTLLNIRNRINNEHVRLQTERIQHQMEAVRRSIQNIPRPPQIYVPPRVVTPPAVPKTQAVPPAAPRIPQPPPQPPRQPQR
ncbi:MAG: hypothetical protein JW994_01255 [Candidatus Omnitrophica bacterium]|nr:hypothetical protein [Candidatus Omnitrophota bacterium]